jgi:transposase
MRNDKLEAVRLGMELEVSVKQACRDLNIHASLLRKLVSQQAADSQQAFPIHQGN